MIYLDNNATTKPDEAVVRAMTEAMGGELWANPSSVHRMGQDARHAMELARASCAGLIGAKPKHITFTSGGTESLDLAIRGVLASTGRRVVVSTGVEHAAVRELLDVLVKEGRIERRLLPLDVAGVVKIGAINGVIDESVAVCVVQWANNETGVVQPVRAIGVRAREVGAAMVCDGTQWVGKMPTEIGETGDGWCDVLTFSPHKFHGPKGVGVMWARSGVRMRPMIHGSQEQGRRGGTENVAGIIGAGAACGMASEWLRDEGQRRALGALRDRFERAVVSACAGAVVNGSSGERLWNTTNIAFPRLEAEALLLTMSELGLCASAGAACSSGSLEPSPVLLAMGIAPELAHGSVRFSLSKWTTEAEIDRAVGIVVESVRRVSMSMRGG